MYDVNPYYERRPGFSGRENAGRYGCLFSLITGIIKLICFILQFSHRFNLYSLLQPVDAVYGNHIGIFFRCWIKRQLAETTTNNKRHTSHAKQARMQIFKQTALLIGELNRLRSQNLKIGFVPTMGALHAGHISLISLSKKENDRTLVSIFVNPTQFNNKDDLKNYPRTLENDIDILASAGCDLLFTPSENEMYPDGAINEPLAVDFGNLDKVLEGKFRPGHFAGVGMIVRKFFETLCPHKAYFGEKDFQQLAIIKHLVKSLGLPVQVVPCPIIREKDGLAMSSRNALLTPAHRASAVLISQTLFRAVEMAQKQSVDETRLWVAEQINTDSLLRVEYFEIVDESDLMPIKDWSEKKAKVGLIAVFAGKVRLIDNIRFNL